MKAVFSFELLLTRIANNRWQDPMWTAGSFRSVRLTWSRFVEAEKNLFWLQRSDGDNLRRNGLRHLSYSRGQSVPPRD